MNAVAITAIIALSAARGKRPNSVWQTGAVVDEYTVGLFLAGQFLPAFLMAGSAGSTEVWNVNQP